MRRPSAALLLLFSTTALVGCGMKSSRPASVAFPVHATVESAPTITKGDAIDDPAFWIHPTDPAKSLVIATNKKEGLYVYDLAGGEVQRLPVGRTNNVDIRYGFPLGESTVDLVATENRTTNTLNLFSVNRASGELTQLDVQSEPFGISEVYGLALYKERRGAFRQPRFFVFVSSKEGTIEQWSLDGSDGRQIMASRVRVLQLPTQTEGLVADDNAGVLYAAEEDFGIWRFDADPAGSPKPTLVDFIGADRHLRLPDVEGLTIYPLSDNTGYLIASSQGMNEYVVYTREGNNDYVTTFSIADGAIDGTYDTDGIDVTAVWLPGFKGGVFAAQDGKDTPSGTQNVKLVPWQAIVDGSGGKLRSAAEGHDPRR